MVKNPPCQCRRWDRHRFDPWVRKIPWKRKWHPTLVFLLGEIHGQRSLTGYNPPGYKELDTTECLNTQHMGLLPCCIKEQTGFCVVWAVMLNSTSMQR